MGLVATIAATVGLFGVSAILYFGFGSTSTPVWLHVVVHESGNRVAFGPVARVILGTPPIGNHVALKVNSDDNRRVAFHSKQKLESSTSIRAWGTDREPQNDSAYDTFTERIFIYPNVGEYRQRNTTVIGFYQQPSVNKIEATATLKAIVPSDHNFMVHVTARHLFVQLTDDRPDFFSPCDPEMVEGCHLSSLNLEVLRLTSDGAFPWFRAKTKLKGRTAVTVWPSDGKLSGDHETVRWIQDVCNQNDILFLMIFKDLLNIPRVIVQSSAICGLRFEAVDSESHLALPLHLLASVQVFVEDDQYSIRPYWTAGPADQFASEVDSLAALCRLLVQHWHTDIFFCFLLLALPGQFMWLLSPAQLLPADVQAAGALRKLLVFVAFCVLVLETSFLAFDWIEPVNTTNDTMCARRTRAVVSLGFSCCLLLLLTLLSRTRTKDATLAPLHESATRFCLSQITLRGSIQAYHYCIGGSFYWIVCIALVSLSAYECCELVVSMTVWCKASQKCSAGPISFGHVYLVLVAATCASVSDIGCDLLPFSRAIFPTYADTIPALLYLGAVLSCSNRHID